MGNGMPGGRGESTRTRRRSTGRARAFYTRGTMNRKIRAASVQFQHAPGDKQANLEKMRGFVRNGARRGVELIAFPEMCVTGYWHVRNLPRAEVDALAEPVPDGPTTAELLALSKEYGM